MDFLLECAGFPPETNVEALTKRAWEEGQGAPWAGSRPHQRRVQVGTDLEVRADRSPAGFTLLPHGRGRGLLRFRIDHLRPSPDSRFEALAVGALAPAPPGIEADEWGTIPLSVWLADGTRARRVPPGSTVALHLAGYALDLESIGEGAGEEGPTRFRPLEGEGDPLACTEVRGRVLSVVRPRNAWSGEDALACEVATPERPLRLWLSPWLVAQEGLPLPEPGHVLEGTFLFMGEIVTGLGSQQERAGPSFG